MGLQPAQEGERLRYAATALYGRTALPFVIPPSPSCRGIGGAMGLQPAQEGERLRYAATTLYGRTALPFVIPSEVEGSAVLQAFAGNVFRQGRSDLSWLAVEANEMWDTSNLNLQFSTPNKTPADEAAGMTILAGSRMELRWL